MTKRKGFIVLLCVIGALGVAYVVHRWWYGPDNLPSGPDLSWVHEPTESTDKLVVFVHGIGSDSKSAWTSDRTGAYWPQLLSNDNDLSSFAILTAI
jgi:hypothetical protein